MGWWEGLSGWGTIVLVGGVASASSAVRTCVRASVRASMRELRERSADSDVTKEPSQRQRLKDVFQRKKWRTTQSTPTSECTSVRTCVQMAHLVEAPPSAELAIVCGATGF